MSRPKKATVDYFPHFVKHGKTMFIIENKYGNNGYAFWFKLLELLGQTENHFLDCNNSAQWEYLLSYTKIEDAIALQMLDLLASLGAIDGDLWKHKNIWSEKLIKNLEDVYSRREVVLYTKDDIRALCQQLYPLKGITVSINPHIILKDSKLKENRVKDIKVSYAEFVNMTEKEYNTLIEKLGKELTENKIEDLNLWKGSKGKKTSSDYMTILSWVRKDKKDTKTGGGGGKKEWNPFPDIPLDPSYGVQK